MEEREQKMTDTAAVTSRRREATRQKLLDAAAQVFAEVGMDAASVEAVCERAGFTRGAFYSNFDSKDELFLELCARVTRDRVAAVGSRVSELERQGGLAGAPDDAFAIVQQLLDFSADDRLSVLLMSEIRIHALRDAQLAAAYLAQEEEMVQSVSRIVDDIMTAGALRFRVTAEEAAGLLLAAWEGASVRAVMRGSDDDELRRRANEELARVAQLIIEPTPG